MYRLLAILAAWLILAAPVHGASANPSYGMHGMVLFGGEDGLYVAHLPMFHAPHDVQMVARVRLADAALDAMLKAELARRPALWTVAPEKFELDRLAPDAAHPLPGFSASLVLGHFEQGGQTRHANVALVVDSVLVYRKLDPAARVAAHARYLQVGRGVRRFLVKEIDSRPDMDHIVAIAVAADTPAGPVTMPRRALEAPGAAAIEAALPGASVLRTVYFETADLR